MSYGYSPAYPRVPNSTPQLSASASIRPPIHNPYDKFTQPQFDEWIGGITSALKRALGQEEEEPPTSRQTTPREEDAHPASDADEDNVEDSLAEWKAMRTKEKGKMRATEDEQDSEYGGSQESYEVSGVRDLAAGDTPDDAIELLSDDDDAGGEELSDRGEYEDGDHDGDVIESSSSVESDGEAERPYVGGPQPHMSPRSRGVFANTPEKQAIEISDGEMESHGQVNDSFEAENSLFGWGQDEEGESQQPPDIRDPWELPKTYAEDLYTGGPIRKTDRQKLSPSHLTPAEEADYFGNIDPRLRPSSVMTSQPAGHALAGVSQGSGVPTLIPTMTNQVSNGDDETSLFDEEVLELDTPATAVPRDESDFVSFTALNQPSDADSEQGGPEILYISDNDGGEVSEDGVGAEEDDFDDDGPAILGTSDLEVPTEQGLGGDEGDELDELEDDDEPVAEVAANNLPYGYYGLDASSVTGSGGFDDETKTIGPPSDVPNGDHNEASNTTISQESASQLDPHNLVPLPAAATFIDTNHQLQPEVSAAIDETAKVTLAEVSFTILDEAVVSVEDVVSSDEDSVGDDTIFADGAVLMVNEVEEVLRDAFAETDQLARTTNSQGGTTSVSDVTPHPEGQVAGTSPKRDPRETIDEISVGGGPLPDEPVIKGDNTADQPPPNVKDEPLYSQEAQKKHLPFVMPLVANPNVRDPMSVPRSPAQSGPSTPVGNLAYLPAVTRFKRDNQLLAAAHSNSGLFTPLEGSGSSSPSPSDTATPEDPTCAEVETEAPTVDDGVQHRKEWAASVAVSPIRDSPDVGDVEHQAIPTGPPEDDDWGEIPLLPRLPVEIVDHVEGTPATVPATRVFFQPEAPDYNVGGLDVRSEADRDGCASLMVAADVSHEERCQDTQGLNNLEPSVHLTDHTARDLPESTDADDPFKLMGNSSAVPTDAVTNDDDASSISSSSPDEEQTPRLKVPEILVPVTVDSLAAEPAHPEIQPRSAPLATTEESPDTPAKNERNLRKRKRSTSIPILSEPSGSDSTIKDKVPDVAITSPGNGEHDEANHELTEEPQNEGGKPDSDTESFASSLIAPRNAKFSSRESSRASSVVSEQPRVLRDRTPVPEDAPVFHGHGKFKAAFQASKLLRRSSETRAKAPGRETERAKEKEQEKEQSVSTKAGSRKSSENSSKDSTNAKKLPPLVIPEVPVRTSLPTTSASQSPLTPTSALPPSSPTVVTTPAEATIPQERGQASQEHLEPDRKPIKKPIVKTVKRTARARPLFERKSTRSQCRYRKISLPREEDGPRVTFCVPQCSLNDKELMEEEEITDDGLATVRDFERLWDHVEEQNLSPDLIGVIKQLVGLDLLRENEIYYLPTDEEIEQMERRRRREERRRSRKSIGGAANAGNTTPTGRSGSGSIAGPASQPSLSQVEKGKLGPPPSFAESASTTSTRSKADRTASARSISEDEMVEGQRGVRASKRRRTGRERDGGRNSPSVHEDSAASSTAGSPEPSQSPIEPTPTRRSQRTLKKAVSTDAQAYKPTASSDESSRDESENVKAKRKLTRGRPKGIKRRRTDGAGDSSISSAAGRDHDALLSPISKRSKRVRIDEK